MDNLHREATQYTPEITLDADAGAIVMVGKSYPENTFEFYAPILDWVTAYLEDDRRSQLRVDMEIVYFRRFPNKILPVELSCRPPI